MPAVRICLIVVLGHIAFVHSVPLLHAYAPILAALCLLLTVTAALWRAWPVVRSLGCATIALMLATSSISSYIPVERGPFVYEQTARIEGYVSRVLSERPRSVRLLIDGEVDSERLPAFHARVVLTVFRDSVVGLGADASVVGLGADASVVGLGPDASVATQGSRVVIYAQIRRPDRATLPGEFDEQAMCRSMHVSYVATADMREVDVRAEPPIMRIVVGNVQDAITRALHTQVEPDVAAVLSAVIIGDETELQPESRSAYAQSGTAHMFSVSGSHVAILLSLGLAFTIAVRRRWLRALLLMFLIIGYVIVSGGSAPAWRAAVMGLLALWGRNTERDVLGLNLLAMAVLCMTILDASLPWSAGFQLSVCATAAILILTPRWNSLLKRCVLRDSAVKRYLRISCAVTLAASAGISLPSALIFGQVALWSPVANFFVVPILSLAMVTGSGLVLAHYAAPWLTPSLAWVCSFLVHAADGIALLFAGLQPDRVSTSHVVAHVTLTMGLCAWPLVARGWTGIFFRQAVCVALMVCVVLVPAPSNVVIQEYQRRLGSVVVIHTAQCTVVMTSLQKRDVAVERYVKSLRGRIVLICRPRASLHR